MKKFLYGTAATLVTGLTFLQAGPAMADQYDVYGYHGSDRGWASLGYTPPPTGIFPHHVIHVKDMECDGDRVQAEYHVSGSANVGRMFHVYDEDGCGSESWSETWPNNKILGFAVCELFDSGRWGCGNWVSVPDGAAT